MGDIQKAKRELLEAAVVRAALALSQYTGCGSFSLPVLHTEPQLYVAFGTKKSLGTLTLEAGNDKPVADSNR